MHTSKILIAPKIAEKIRAASRAAKASKASKTQNKKGTKKAPAKKVSAKTMLLVDSYDKGKTVSAYLSLGDFQQKRAKLESTRAFLKDKFVGIDSQIDHAIDSITFWYLYPEKVTRPLIICLWGMTGTGKTALVRDISLKLGMHTAYSEIVMNDETSKRNDSFVSKLLEFNGSKDGRQGIVLLDEFQRFATKDEHGHVKREMGYTAVWQVLSDGKYIGTIDKWDVTNDIDELKDKSNKRITKISTGIVVGDKLIRTLFYEKCLNDAGISTSKMTVLAMLNKLRDLFVVSGTSQLTYTMDFTGTAFFVVGNLDDAFNDKFMSNSDYVSPDEYNRWGSLVDIYAIKKALKKRFLPEQISRLGNVHIVYPVLNTNNYRCLIHKELRTLFDGMDCANLQVDDSFVDMVLRNGVFPTQGVRPVFTTCRQIAEFVCSKVLNMDFTKSGKVYYDPGRIVVMFDDGLEESKYFMGDKDKFLMTLDNNPEYLKIVCVHEAGHALAFRVLFGEFPECVLIHPQGGQNVHGNTKSSSTVLGMIANGIMGLSGMIAEEMMISKGHFSIGSGPDIESATGSAAHLVRNLGISMTLADTHQSLADSLQSDRAVYRCVPAGSDSEDLADYVVEDRNDDVKRFMAFFFTQARKLLSPLKAELSEISEQLMKSKYIHKCEFVDKPSFGKGMVKGMENPFTD